MASRKRILITGINGFIGRSLFMFIKNSKLNYDVFGIDIKSNHLNKNIFLHDLNNQKKLFSTLSKVKPDYIFHFAGGRIQNEKELFRANYQSTKSLFEVLKETDYLHPRIIIPGTAAECGKVKSQVKVIKEGYPSRPVSWYGFVKYLQTNLGLMYAKIGFNVAIARMFNILGNGTPPTLAVGKFSKEISLIEKKGRPKSIQTKNLDGKRDFLDINDVCSALLSVAHSGRSGEIYNICSGKSNTIRDLLQKLLNLSSKKDIVVEEDKRGSSGSYDVIGANSKIKRETRWRPKISVEKSLKSTLDYYRNIM